MLCTHWVVLQLRGLELREPKPFVPDNKQIDLPSTPAGNVLTSKAVCYTNILEKIVPNKRVINASAQKKCRNARHGESPNTSLFLIFSLVYFLIVFCWTQNISSLKAGSFSVLVSPLLLPPKNSTYHIVEIQSIHVEQINLLKSYLSFKTQLRWPILRGAIPDPWNWDLVFRHLNTLASSFIILIVCVPRHL